MARVHVYDHAVINFEDESHTYEEREPEESRGGKQNISGQKSSKESKTHVALAVSSLGNIRSGTITTCIPAANADATPFGESSNTSIYIITYIRVHTLYIW